MVNVVVIGTAHHWHLNNPMFSLEILIDLIKKTNPDLICAELSPEQLNGTITCNSKPEYPKAIIPFAREQGISIVPFQPCTAEGLYYGDRKKRVSDKIKSTPDLSGNWEFWMDLGHSMEEVNSPTLFAFQSRAYDTWVEIIYEKLQSRILHAMWELWDEWNRSFFAVIKETIKENPGKRITVTVGNKHKYWLNNRLKVLESVSFEHIQDYLDSKTKPEVNNRIELTGSILG